jgi:hypothetical protein
MYPAADGNEIKVNGDNLPERMNGADSLRPDQIPLEGRPNTAGRSS